MRNCLLDTGPLVAYLDARDPAHPSVAAWFGRYTGHLATTSAVITEAMHFVTGTREGPELIAELITVTRTGIHGYERAAELRAAVSLMHCYDDLPMDYADATLLLLADSLEIDDIVTLDRRGFSSYRTPRGRALRLALDLA